MTARNGAEPVPERTPATRRAVDLHSHSTASDGAAAPNTAVEVAAAAGLSALAVTDHDTLSGIAAARAAGERLGVRIVPGVELSVFHGDREVHLLGLHIERVDELEQQLAALRDTRRTRAVRIVEKLNALGVPVTADAVFALAGEGAVGRPHVARALIAGGWARDQRDAFDRWLGAGRPANVEKERISVAEGTRMVHEAGGIVVLAHPGADGRAELLRPLVDLGLDGIEVLHPGHAPADGERLAALAGEFGLVPSGGSDWHGAMAGPRVLGSMKVPAAWLERQDAVVARRRAPAT